MHTILNYDVMFKNISVFIFHFWWKIIAEKLMLIPFLYKKLWAIPFYQVLYGNYWKFEISDLEITNIIRLINSTNEIWNENWKTFKIRIYQNLQSFGFTAIIVFKPLKVLLVLGRNKPSRLNRIKSNLRFHLYASLKKESKNFNYKF